jgi:apolipoprotein D and lipocalin family protein
MVWRCCVIYLSLEVVPYVELEKYLGKWYEIAHLPAKFQDGCNETTATYTLSKDGSISVLNQCTKNGKMKQAKGKAKVVDKNLGNNYDYAVVGTPNRKYLWILSRTPQMDDKLYSQLIEYVKSKGFDVNKLIETLQKA